MTLRITPGPLPADATRIVVQTILSAFVGGTKVTNFGAADFGADSAINFVISQTEAPASETRGRGTVWFERGAGALYKWQPVLLETGVTSGSAPTDFKWVQIGGKKRTNLVYVYRPCLKGELLGPVTEVVGGPDAVEAGTHTDGRFRTMRSIEDHHTIIMSSTSPTSGHLGRNFVLDPQMVAEETIATASDYFVMADWGFVDALCFGTGKYVCIYGAASGPSGASEGSSQLYGQCTTHSAAGDFAAVVGFRTGSDSTDGLRLIEIFKKPSMANMVHG